MEFLAYIGALTLLTIIIILLSIVPIFYIKYKMKRNFKNPGKNSHKKKICKKCGAALASTATTCPICGYKF